ncbi:hypothetical protein [Pseudoteredinibacter isoporae]|uniref:Lipoprotein n=1 Tax=Pseudoteredinibacter isoporae TaxID=570281 RepID=A0A7X0MX81_9GAMM|nr:hypothetical protein [Pseudoteredinibacter isoporae]MBB6523441.1 hypothetical protein [Pseudoteredinibacter isoporae]NHO88950.1 hypothetical protein [Pseudoteredinibacter isoporae]NIB24342.1 hypothetical protein [Pseudoteredinibacter isoporae]
MIARFARLILALSVSLQACSSQGRDYIEYHTDSCLVRVEYKGEAQYGVLKLISSWKNGDIGWCETTKEDFQISLDSAMKKLVVPHTENKLTSVQIGQLSNYSWVRNRLKNTDSTVSGNGKYHISEYLKVHRVLDPISSVLEKYGWIGQAAQCEKAEYNNSGIPIDGFCWLKVERLGTY